MKRVVEGQIRFVSPQKWSFSVKAELEYSQQEAVTPEALRSQAY